VTPPPTAILGEGVHRGNSALVQKLLIGEEYYQCHDHPTFKSVLNAKKEVKPLQGVTSQNTKPYSKMFSIRMLVIL
jgi:hypothetical protein